uniref:DDE Tnp4 domain-containing protein n=1 Tax=Dicentrarchus labrax TaxID=13489 RepID=A0A8P4GSU7_DICLA
MSLQRFVAPEQSALGFRSSWDADTQFRRPISVRKRVGVGLYWLATGTDYPIVHEFCKAVRQVLMPEFIKLPKGDALREVLQGFQMRCGFPQCTGAIDGGHIPVIDTVDFSFSFSKTVSLTCFTKTGMCFSVIAPLEIGVYLLSTVSRKCLKCSFSTRDSGRQHPIIKSLTMASLMAWNLTEQQRYFNERHSKAREPVECAFGRLKGWWRCLGKQLDVDISTVPTIISACCTLHNVCEKHGEAYEGPGQAILQDNWIAEGGAQDAAQPTRVREAAYLCSPGHMFPRLR